MAERRLPEDVQRRVESALKATVESELQRATAQRARPLEYFSRGAIFSRSNGFDKGIIFSRTSDIIDRIDEREILSTLANLDDQTISAFAERLAQVNSVKNLKESTGGPAAG
jgi:hypothetical protein